MDNELLLFDRINVIKDVITKYGEENFYLSFSGGKDSTILHYLIDWALPGNTIPRVFINTGIEYQAIVDFVKGLAKDDPRFIILQPTQAIKPMLEKYGYPFKSKEFAHHYGIYQHSGKVKSVLKFLGENDSGAKNKLIVCPAMLKPLFTEENRLPFKVSSDCCRKMKKEPIKKWEKQNNRHVAITGMRASEGGQRMRIDNCILTDSQGNLKRFHPLIKVDEEWEDWLIHTHTHTIALCKLYCQPYNFKRTGCKGCPFSLDLQEQLETMETYMPNERKQCEFIWKPVYEKYRELNYRLKKFVQIKLDLGED